jgi:hypothetical protein
MQGACIVERHLCLNILYIPEDAGGSVLAVITLDTDALPYGSTSCSVPRPSWLHKVDVGMENSILTMTNVPVRGGSQTIMV